ncbi:MAG: large conductance mechanosensitive channel protein MscL [Acidobacteriota bacterium]|nr:large conductance mechanosensitive channel protein MscL [Acidobacteriota bacterium]
MWKEFREFAARGNVLDLAVGVIIGAAFGRIISSFVTDIVMPPIGMAIGGLDFSNLFVALNGVSYPSLAAAQAAGAPTINYGRFGNTVLEFVVVALVIFLFVRQINRMKTPEPAVAKDDARDCPYCVSRIPIKASRCPHCTSEVRLSA